MEMTENRKKIVDDFCYGLLAIKQDVERALGPPIRFKVDWQKDTLTIQGSFNHKIINLVELVGMKEKDEEISRIESNKESDV